MWWYNKNNISASKMQKVLQILFSRKVFLSLPIPELVKFRQKSSGEGRCGMILVYHPKRAESNKISGKGRQTVSGKTVSTSCAHACS